MELLWRRRRSSCSAWASSAGFRKDGGSKGRVICDVGSGVVRHGTDQSWASWIARWRRCDGELAGEAMAGTSTARE